MSVLEIDSNEEVMEADEVRSPNLPWLVMSFQAPGAPTQVAFPCVVVGELIDIKNSGRKPLVAFPGQPGTEAITARTVIDLHGFHIGSAVVLMFEGADPSKPIIIGILNEDRVSPSKPSQSQVEVDADGQCYLISAQEQIVLRCGKASITLTKAGKVLINGAYISSRSSGAHRIKGGSVEIN